MLASFFDKKNNITFFDKPEILIYRACAASNGKFWEFEKKNPHCLMLLDYSRKHVLVRTPTHKILNTSVALAPKQTYNEFIFTSNLE